MNFIDESVGNFLLESLDNHILYITDVNDSEITNYKFNK